MCNFYSGLYNHRTGTIYTYPISTDWPPCPPDVNPDSHAAIENAHDLRPDRLADSALARFEYSTDGLPDDFKSYTLRCDEERKPDWWDEVADSLAKRVRARMMEERVTQEGESVGILRAGFCYSWQRVWLRNGKRHREDGPAVEWAEATREYWVNGKFIR